VAAADSLADTPLDRTHLQPTTMSQESPTLLVFPINVDSAVPVIRHARMLGYRIIGASSVFPLPTSAGLDACIHLPFVTAPDFLPALKQALGAHRVTHLYAPHHGVWSHLTGLSAEQEDIRSRLCGVHPFEQHWNDFLPSLEWAGTQHADSFADSLMLPGTVAAPALGVAGYSSIHRGFLRIPGESDEAKLAALCSLARVTPPGDVVEIGVLYGRSAYALGRLAHAHGIGSFIGVDPWNLGQITDQGEQAAILERERGYVDCERIFLEFLATAAEVPGMSFIRDVSQAAIKTYAEAARAGHLATAALPAVPLKGGISLLHIDGNHRYDQVLLDIQTWTPFLIPGGWLLLDDYVWAFGDGPQRAGDQLLDSGEFDCAFTCSDTLFLRKRSNRPA